MRRTWYGSLESREESGWCELSAELRATPFESPLKKCAVALALREIEVYMPGTACKQRWYRVRQTSFEMLSLLLWKKGEETLWN